MCIVTRAGSGRPTAGLPWTYQRRIRGANLVGENIAGASVQITDRVAALARPAEILVSRTVKDLVTGTGISFAERGSHRLDGPSEKWTLFAVTGFAAVAPGR
jgi:class 3 adenylate cyclase